jgi:hypothetical protein
MDRRFFLPTALLLLASHSANADYFELYTNDLLAKIPNAEGVRKVKELTPELLVEHGRVLPNIRAAFVVVKTNEGRYSKLLVQAGGQKLGDKTQPILSIERFVTFKEGEERTILAEGKSIRLFQDFQFSLDFGQVVPASVGGDIRLVVTEAKTYVEPIGKAEIYLVTKPLADVAAKKSDKVIVGATFERQYFSGAYKLYDDGRRTGKLVLKVGPGGDVDGWYYSDKDGAKYEVTGKVGDPNHTIKFRVQLPRAAQEFQGWMFTGDGRAICGISRLLEREAGFYATRIEDD